MQRTEQPIRFFSQIARMATESHAEIVADGIEDHENRMHIPPKRRDPVQAVPFPDERIPDVELVKMIELMESEGHCIEQVARSFHRPISLVLRCMADYQIQFKRYIQHRALD